MRGETPLPVQEVRTLCREHRVPDDQHRDSCTIVYGQNIFAGCLQMLLFFTLSLLADAKYGSVNVAIVS